MWLAIALVVFVLWILGAFVFEVVSALIHLLIILAIGAVILHFMRGKRAS